MVEGLRISTTLVLVNLDLGINDCKFPETRRPGRLCNEMKAPGHERKLQLDGTEKPSIQKTLDCYGDFRNLCGRPRQRCDLDDEFFYGIAVYDLADVNCGVAAFLPFHAARWRSRR